MGGVGVTAALPYLQGCAPGSAGRVVIVGGGFGGATCAAYLARAGAHVILVERSRQFVTCPFSNSVLGGFMEMSAITHGYDGLRKRGVRVVTATVSAVEAGARQVILEDGTRLDYDRLVLAACLALQWDGGGV